MKIHRIAAFTENGVGGNPAGVVLLDALPKNEDMQKVAAEVGYSETVFAAPHGESWTTRYFSPESEVPFCGHATIALGAVLAKEYGAGRYQLSLSEGDIDVTASMENGESRSTLSSRPTHNEPIGETVIDEALQLFGYNRDDLDPELPSRRINAGAAHLFFALKSREQLARMHYDLAAGRAFMQRHSLVTVAFVWRESEDLFHARNAFASGGVLEDPATGAAAAAIAGMLRDEGLTERTDLTILQGADMGRPSRINVQFTAPMGSPVFVGGTSSKIEDQS